MQIELHWLTSLAIDSGGRLFLLINNLFSTILLNFAFVLRARNLYSCQQNVTSDHDCRMEDLQGKCTIPCSTAVREYSTPSTAASQFCIPQARPTAWSLPSTRHSNSIAVSPNTFRWQLKARRFRQCWTSSDASAAFVRFWCLLRMSRPSYRLLQ